MPSNGSAKTGGKRAAARLRPNARGRSSGRLTLQERQKQDSRDRLLVAAREVLEEMPYALVAVEDIIGRAQVSRATFYRHFASKFAIGKALHAAFWPRLFALYEKGLAGERTLSEAVLARWIRTILAFYREERTLVITFRQMMVIEPEFAPVTDEASRHVMEALAASNPGFAPLLDKSVAGRRARVDARLLLGLLDDFCYEAVFHDWLVAIDDGVRIVARNFRRLIDDISQPGAAAEPPQRTRRAGRRG